MMPERGAVMVRDGGDAKGEITMKAPIFTLNKNVEQTKEVAEEKSVDQPRTGIEIKWEKA